MAAGAFGCTRNYGLDGPFKLGMAQTPLHSCAKLNTTEQDIVWANLHLHSYGFIAQYWWSIFALVSWRSWVQIPLKPQNCFWAFFATAYKVPVEITFTCIIYIEFSTCVEWHLHWACHVESMYSSVLYVYLVILSFEPRTFLLPYSIMGYSNFWIFNISVVLNKISLLNIFRKLQPSPRERTKSLQSALTEILWRAGTNKTATVTL